MRLATTKFLIAWGLFLFLGMMVFQFLHECGHGFGSQLDSEHVSTGFSRVGDHGKRPADLDFRSEKKVTGILGSAGLLDPFTNWILIKTHPALFLSEPRFYFWPLLSFSIVLLCFVLAYRQLYTVFYMQLSSRFVR